MRYLTRHCVVRSVALDVTSVQNDHPSAVKSDVESMVFGVEILPVGIQQELRMSVEVLVVTVNEPGAKTPERGMSVNAEKTTIIGLKKGARGRVLYSWSWRSI